MKKIENQSNTNGMNLFMTVKSMLKHFTFIKTSKGLFDEEKNCCMNNDGCFL